MSESNSSKKQSAELKYWRLTAEIFRILNENIKFDEAIRQVLAEIKKQTGCDAVGLRLQKGNDFPYLVQEGFSEDFLLTENSLLERNTKGEVCRDDAGNICLECTCGLILSGKTDPESPLFTEYGSCWTSNSEEVLELSEEDDPRHNPRNRCIHDGYSSIMLVPIKKKDEVVGMLQLNDSENNKFSEVDVEAFENISRYIGNTLMRRHTEKELQAANQQLRATEQQLKAYNQQLEASERRFKTMLEKFNEVIWMFASDWSQLLYISENQYETLFGGSVEELRENPESFLEYIHPDDRERVSRAMNSLSEGKKIEMEFRVNPDEDYGRWLWNQGYPIQDKEGNIDQVVGSSREITRRKEAEMVAEERLKEMRCLYKIGKFLEEQRGLPEDVLRKIIKIIPEGWTRSEMVEARIVVDEMDVQTAEFVSDPGNNSTKIFADGDEIGLLEVSSSNPASGQLKKMDTDLLYAIADRIGMAYQKQKSSAELRKMRRAIEQSPATVVITDAEGNIEYANPRFVELTGWKISTVKGKNPRFLKSEKHTDEFYENFWDTISSGKIWRGEFCNQKKNGELYWEDASVAPVFESGEITNYIKVGEDITAQRRSRRNLEKINNCFINFSPEPQKNIQRLTGLAGELLDGVSALYNRLESGKLFTEVGWSLPSDFKRHDDPEGHICYDLIQSDSDQVLALNNLQESDYKKKDPNVSKYELQSYIGHVVRRSGEPVGNICVVYDKNIECTSEKKTIMELIASAIEIEEERRRILDELRRSNEDLKNFANIAAHDLKHPLRTVASYMELLQRRYSEDLEEKASEYIQRAVRGAYHMQELLDGLLRYSRVETGESGFEKVNVNNIVSQVSADLELIIEENDAEIVYSDLPSVKGDSSLLARLFQNLINNAITYSSDELPEIEISAEKTGEMWRISISDNGIGIEEQYQEKIFEVFQRLHTHDEISGTGIGLAVCKKIVELHGGEIAVESIPGEGTTFSFTLTAA